MALRTLTARLLFSAALLLALLLLAEVLLWATGWVRDPHEFRFRRATSATEKDDEGRYREHPARFYALAPHFRHGPEHLGRDALGDWPFRGRPPEPSPPGLLRVAVVGDSCVYGASLDACNMLGTRLADELAARGLGPDRLAVLSLGVPGYSTVQIGLLLDEALATLHPDAIVLYPAAWNDQAPALRAPDRELLAALADPSPLDWLAGHSRIAAALLRKTGELPVESVNAAWLDGHPPFGWRVPAADVGPNVSSMLQRCAAASVPAVVIAPPHPPKTLAEHPRTAQDAAAVLAAAQQAGVPALDGQLLLFASGEDLARFFSDYVHPSPDAIARLVPAVADALLPDLQRRAERQDASTGQALRIVAVQPAVASRFGDEPLRVTLEGWTRSEPLPAVIVGGAPLIDVHAAAPASPGAGDSVEGLLMANGAGLHDVVVQTARGCAVLPRAVELRDPELTVVAGEPARLRASGRPGDGLQLFVGTARREAPVWSNRGAAWLADGKPLAASLRLDATGVAELPLPALPAGTFLVQCLVTPRGEPATGSTAVRWTGVTELSAGN